MTEAVRIEDLWFSFNAEAVLQGINVTVEDRTFFGIVGPNGAGKTTLIKIIAGLLKPARGNVLLFGQRPERAGYLLGYVPQYFFSDAAFPITVLETALMGRLSGHKLLRRYTGEDRQAAIQALETVGMAELRHKPIGSLSGGQRQRVLLARALAGNPRLLLLDEPLSGVDISLEFEFYELLRSLKEKLAIILISHDVGVISQYVDVIACLNKTIFCHQDKEVVLRNLEKMYGCPVDIIAHGIPHRVLREHGHDGNS